MCDNKNNASNHSPHGSSQDDPLTRSVHGKVSMFQEFYIEFFATFIPGFVFLILLSLVGIYAVFPWFSETIVSFLNGNVKNMPLEFSIFIHGVGHWCVLFAIAIVAYTVGAIFYRKEPNLPDKISAHRQWRKSDSDERGRLAVQFKDVKCGFIKDCKKCLEEKKEKTSKTTAKQCSVQNKKKKSFVEKVKSCICLALYNIYPSFSANNLKVEGYPYSFLRQYLLRRGMWHLACFVPWCKHIKDGAESQRSKVTINALKTVIKMYGNGTFVLDLIRNEGHIRMLTSLWYVMRISRNLLLFSFCFHIVFQIVFFKFVASSLILFFVLMVAVLWCKYSIEDAIHYVRSREIVTVLEQAYIVRDQMKYKYKDSDIWKDLEERNKRFCTDVEESKKCCKDCEKTLCLAGGMK